jgi:hypothetical protein
MPIRPINQSQQERHYYEPFHQLAARQRDAPPSEKGSYMDDLPRPPSPFSRLRTIPASAKLDHDEQSRKRQRTQYEPVVISPRCGAAGSSLSSSVEHSGSGGLSRPPQPYFEQPMRQQAPLRSGSQSRQLSRSSLPEYHARDFEELTSSDKHNSGIYYKSHDRSSQRPGFQSSSSAAQLQPLEYTPIYQQPPCGSLNVPHPSDDKRPTFVRDDQSVAAWGGHPRHLRLGNDSVYRPQETHLERTSFHPYFESYRAVPHESRIFGPHYLKPVDNHKPHGRSLNFQPESNRPSFREPPRLQSNTSMNSWNVSREDEPTPVRPPVLDGLPNSQNALDVIGTDHQQYDARYLMSGSTPRRVNAPVPKVDSRRYAKVYCVSGGYLSFLLYCSMRGWLAN